MTDVPHRFIVKEEFEDNSSCLRLIDTTEGFSVAVIPGLGGMLHSVTTDACDKKIELLDNYSSISEAKRKITTSYKGSNLAPYPNRIKDGRYSFHGKTYQLPINLAPENNAIHGLLYDRPFTLTDKTEGNSECSITLIHYYKGDV